jgi:hypothetical protein
MNNRADVVLILSNSDVVDLVMTVLEQRHLRTIGIEPCQDRSRVEYLISESNPAAVLFDLCPPFQESIALARLLLNSHPDRLFVFTCAHVPYVTSLAPWLCHHLVIQTPYEPNWLGETICCLLPEQLLARQPLAIGAAGV